MLLFFFSVRVVFYPFSRLLESIPSFFFFPEFRKLRVIRLASLPPPYYRALDHAVHISRVFTSQFYFFLIYSVPRSPFQFTLSFPGFLKYPDRRLYGPVEPHPGHRFCVPRFSETFRFHLTGHQGSAWTFCSALTCEFPIAFASPIHGTFSFPSSPATGPLPIFVPP